MKYPEEFRNFIGKHSTLRFQILNMILHMMHIAPSVVHGWYTLSGQIFFSDPSVTVCISTITCESISFHFHLKWITWTPVDIWLRR